MNKLDIHAAVQIELEEVYFNEGIGGKSFENWKERACGVRRNTSGG